MNANQAGSAGPREWIGLAVLALPILLLSMDVTVLYLAVPDLVADLQPSNNQLLWIVDVYGFMIAGFLITMGTLGDRIGRRKLLMIGATAFGVASAVAAFAPNPELLIAARALLGIAGATLMPSTLALISNMFRDPRQRGIAIGVWATCLSAGVAVGPIAGGLLLEAFWWGSVFLLGVPVMVLLLVTAPVLLPEFRDTAASRIDLPSVGLSLAAILPIVYGIKQFATDGLTVAPATAAVVGVGFAALFVRRQRTLPDPLLDLHMFGNRSFSAALGLLLATFSMMGGIYLFVTHYLQLVEDLSSLAAGMWLLPPALALIVSSMLTPIIARTIRPGDIVAAAAAISALGYLALATLGSVSGLPVLVAGFTLIYIGTGPIMVLGTDLVVATAPAQKAGSAAAMSETASEFGLAIGIAILGVVGTGIYRADVADSIPAQLPPGAADPARETLAGAHAASQHLPHPLGDALLGAAREAFTNGLNTVAFICALVAVALAVVAAASLRHVRAGAAHESTPTTPPPTATVTT